MADLKPRRGETFAQGTVPLDGFAFYRCTFGDGVRLYLDGSAPFQLSECRFGAIEVEFGEDARRHAAQIGGLLVHAGTGDATQAAIWRLLHRSHDDLLRRE